MNNEPVLTEYISVYDEALRTAYNKVARGKFGDNVARQNTLTPEEQQLLENTIQIIIQFKADLASILKRIRSKFSTLGSKTLELKLKNTVKFKPFNQSLFADSLSGSMSSNIADVKFPGEFGIAIEEFKEIYKAFLNFINNEYRGLPQRLKTEIPPVYDPYEVLKNLQLTQKSAHGSNDTLGYLDAIRFGITPVNEGGFYRLHAVNPPLDFFKSSTKGIGLGKYLYLGVIHHCGHGYTTSSSTDALNMWKSMIKRTDIYSFMAPECGNGTLLAISIKLSPEQIIELLDKFIHRKSLQWSRDRQGVTRNFLNWIAYRKMFYGDTPIEILDDELYVLLRSTIDAYIEPSNLERLFPGQTPAEPQVDPTSLPPDPIMERILIDNLRDNGSAMNTILPNIGDAHSTGTNITGSIWQRATQSLTALQGRGSDDMKTFWRSYYFLLRKDGNVPAASAILSKLNKWMTSLQVLNKSFLHVSYYTSNIIIKNLGHTGLKIGEINNILEAIYSKYTQDVRIWIALGVINFASSPDINDHLNINLGRKYINLPDQTILNYEKQQIESALVTTKPTTPGSTVQTPPVQPTPAPTTRTTQRGQRRQAGNSSYIASWISSVGKTNTSIIQYITRNSLAKMYRNYVRWLNTTHPTSNPVSQLTFRQWIGSNYPEAERVIGR